MFFNSLFPRKIVVRIDVYITWRIDNSRKEKQ